MHPLPIAFQRCRRIQRHCAPFIGPIGDHQYFAEFGNFECRPDNSRLLQQLAYICESTELEAASSLKKSLDLICEFLLARDPRNISRGAESHNSLSAQLRSAVRKQNFA